MQNIDLKNLDKSDWTVYRFEQIAEKISETVNPEQADVEVYVGLEHLDAEDIHIRRRGVPSDVKGGKLRCHPGDIIFGKRRAYQRKAAIVDFEGICSAHAFVFRANPEVIDPDLLPFFLHSDEFMHRMVDISVGGLSPTINWGDLKHQEFLLPPKDQQTELAELLWAMDKVIESNCSTLDALKTYKRRISYDCYYSEEVEKVNLEDLTVKIQDGSHFSPHTLYSENDGSKFRYVTSKNIRVKGVEFKEDQFVDKDFHDSIFPRCDVRKGDVLLTKDGANTGTATINTLDEEFSLLSSVCLIRSNEMTSNDYLCQYINSDIGNYNLVNQMTGTAITRLTLATLKKVKIPIPSLERQDEVVDSLIKVDSAFGKTHKAIESARSLQKSLINQIF